MVKSSAFRQPASGNEVPGNAHRWEHGSWRCGIQLLMEGVDHFRANQPTDAEDQ